MNGKNEGIKYGILGGLLMPLFFDLIDVARMMFGSFIQSTFLINALSFILVFPLLIFLEAKVIFMFQTTEQNESLKQKMKRNWIWSLSVVPFVVLLLLLQNLIESPVSGLIVTLGVIFLVILIFAIIGSKLSKK